MARMTPDEARQYLAEKAAQEEWRPTKPLDDYQDAQVVRKAGAFQRQERAGLPLSNQVARGHGTREGGHTPQNLPAPKEAYDLATKRAKGVPEATVAHQGNRTTPQFEPTTATQAERTIDFIESVAPSTHVSITYVGQDGKWHVIYQKGGIKIETLKQKLKDYDGDFDDWLADEEALVYGSDEDTAPAAQPQYRVVVLTR